MRLVYMQEELSAVAGGRVKQVFNYVNSLKELDSSFLYMS